MWSIALHGPYVVPMWASKNSWTINRLILLHASSVIRSSFSLQPWSVKTKLISKALHWHSNIWVKTIKKPHLFECQWLSVLGHLLACVFDKVISKEILLIMPFGVMKALCHFGSSWPSWISSFGVNMILSSHDFLQTICCGKFALSCYSGSLR